MNGRRIAILHYTAPPIVGGVEAVIAAHAREFCRAGYQPTVIAGRGELAALPPGTSIIQLPELDTRHPDILRIGEQLERGHVPAEFEAYASRLTGLLGDLLAPFDHLIVHNVLTKHFNLPLTAALHALSDLRRLPPFIAWCHDMSWTSPNSRAKLYDGFPWDLLRQPREEIKYVAISGERQRQLAELLRIPLDRIPVVYNGVDPGTLLGLSPAGHTLIEQLELWDSDLTMLMPVRVTAAKNIEFALDVLACLRESIPRPRLVVTGPPDPHDAGIGGYLAELLKQRSRRNLDEMVRFVCRAGPDLDLQNTISARVVGDLYRVSDLMFMPSHREGFGMPVLEAGLIGIPVVCAAVPAAVEIGRDDLIQFSLDESAAAVAGRILTWSHSSPPFRLRRRVRQHYRWQVVFEREIAPLLDQPGGGR